MTESSQYAPEELRSRLEDVRSRIEDACARSGRPEDDVALVAVSKTHPARAMKTLYEAGHRVFGESYVQEWEEKASELPADIEWHFVGHLQSNKAKYVADDVAMVHSVDRRSVMKELNKRSDGRVDVLLQVNIAGQDSKSGVEPEMLGDLCEMTTSYTSLRPRGLMTLPPYVEDAEDNRKHFARMRELFDEARAFFERETEDAETFEHLSMGMTADFEVAVEEGATIVRVGTGLFGQRHYDE